jgi:hypothetical protein
MLAGSGGELETAIAATTVHSHTATTARARLLAGS